MQVRLRLGSGIARFAPAPLISLDLAEGADVAAAYREIEARYPDLAAVLPSALPVVAGRHVLRTETLHPGDEVALLMPVSGGSLVTSSTRSSHGH
jgi:molybdopterin converting factor small subunit